MEDRDLNNNSSQDREELNEGYAEYIKWMGLQDSLMRQKSRANWFREGVGNTNYFHVVLRERRRRIYLYRIKNHRDVWIQGEDKIATAAIKHFKIFFNLNQDTRIRESLLDCIPAIITDEDNQFLTTLLEEEEIK